MIVNDINGPDLTWTQSGTGSHDTKGGELQPGEFSKPFTPVGKPPYKVVLSVSNGFTVNGIEDPNTMITFNNIGSATKAILTVQVD
ncbi:MAG TPA: hypothetical protein VGE98_04345 [Thermoanaerobaculia bacterium]